ncbi:MAG: hypothetical protein L0Z50_03310 [Verrucomicrobiales bacterium]|nr:hypothetical protein [Verrucomicrobiales bacterium]
MKSFEQGLIERQPIPQNLMRTIRLLGEFRGKEEMFKQQSPQVLETLRQVAMIQSTESSNRIEGVTAPHDRIVQLVAKKTKPRDRSEQEIAGYRDVLNTIHANYANMPFGVGWYCNCTATCSSLRPSKAVGRRRRRTKLKRGVRTVPDSSGSRRLRPT